MFIHQKSVGERDAKYLQRCDPLHVRENRRTKKTEGKSLIIIIMVVFSVSLQEFYTSLHFHYIKGKLNVVPDYLTQWLHVK